MFFYLIFISCRKDIYSDKKLLLNKNNSFDISLNKNRKNLVNKDVIVEKEEDESKEENVDNKAQNKLIAREIKDIENKDSGEESLNSSFMDTSLEWDEEQSSIKEEAKKILGELDSSDADYFLSNMDLEIEDKRFELAKEKVINLVEYTAILFIDGDPELYGILSNSDEESIRKISEIALKRISYQLTPKEG